MGEFRQISIALLLILTNGTYAVSAASPVRKRTFSGNAAANVRNLDGLVASTLESASPVRNILSGSVAADGVVKLLDGLIDSTPDPASPVRKHKVSSSVAGDDVIKHSNSLVPSSLGASPVRKQKFSWSSASDSNMKGLQEIFNSTLEESSVVVRSAKKPKRLEIDADGDIQVFAENVEEESRSSAKAPVSEQSNIVRKMTESSQFHVLRSVSLLKTRLVVYVEQAASAAVGHHRIGTARSIIHLTVMVLTLIVVLSCCAAGGLYARELAMIERPRSRRTQRASFDKGAETEVLGTKPPTASQSLRRQSSHRRPSTHSGGNRSSVSSHRRPSHFGNRLDARQSQKPPSRSRSPSLAPSDGVNSEDDGYGSDTLKSFAHKRRLRQLAAEVVQNENRKASAEGSSSGVLGAWSNTPSAEDAEESRAPTRKEKPTSGQRLESRKRSDGSEDVRSCPAGGTLPGDADDANESTDDLNLHRSRHESGIVLPGGAGKRTTLRTDSGYTIRVQPPSPRKEVESADPTSATVDGDADRV